MKLAYRNEQLLIDVRLVLGRDLYIWYICQSYTYSKEMALLSHT